MLPPHFTIQTEPDRRLVHITMAGFFMPDDIAGFAQAAGRAILGMPCPPNEHVTLVDICAMNIQSQTSVDGFARLLNTPTIRSRKIAFVVDTSLCRMQIQRAASGRDAGFFKTVEEAEAWLFPDS
ncbi:hypothetical protein SAMN05192583_2601 [Sphingomonas gellani]|uniref:SpoIIAA-like n=1 Tax=Sphingomonas gellani TaxID=1166340 RepID=A0A1H8FY51_9SPHN|nr:hypothetical protein [Sphingomonas gellani]SEN36018.1 hypothetical protein SAMN05192583_2601 [Sphingomonas gellani]